MTGTMEIQEKGTSNTVTTMLTEATKKYRIILITALTTIIIINIALLITLPIVISKQGAGSQDKSVDNEATSVFITMNKTSDDLPHKEDEEDNVSLLSTDSTTPDERDDDVEKIKEQTTEELEKKQKTKEIITKEKIKKNLEEIDSRVETFEVDSPEELDTNPNDVVDNKHSLKWRRKRHVELPVLTSSELKEIERLLYKRESEESDSGPKNTDAVYYSVIKNPGANQTPFSYSNSAIVEQIHNNNDVNMVIPSKFMNAPLTQYTGNVIPNTTLLQKMINGTLTDNCVRQNGKCVDPPKLPHIKYNDIKSSESMWLECETGYRLPSGGYYSMLKAIDNKWVLTAENNLPLSKNNCKPFCSTKCQNKGTCVRPEECQCLKEYTGRFCEKRTCSGSIPIVPSGQIIMGPYNPYLRCNKGFQLSRGRTTSEMTCKNNEWKFFHRSPNSNIPVCERIPILNCTGSYPDIINGEIDTRYSGIITARCNPGHATVSKEIEVTLGCDATGWVMESEPSLKTIECLPYCETECQNGGICKSDGCSCLEGYTGKYCEIKTCLQAPRFTNAAVIINGDSAIVACEPGYAFEHQTPPKPSMELKCISGIWKYPPMSTYPLNVCVPECSKPCQNGGICIAPCVCKCPDHYEGPECQYVVSTCNNNLKGIENGYTTSIASKKDSMSFSLTCYKGYLISNMLTSINIKCKKGVWIIDGYMDNNAFLGCQPVCRSRCLNGGTCTSPDVCSCPPFYGGNQCEVKLVEGCLSPPFIPNSDTRYTSDGGVITCQHGYSFVSGVTEVEIACKDTMWTTHDNIRVSKLQCIPICLNKCLNGGRCINPEVCECTKMFTGPQCQIEMSVPCISLPPPVPNSVIQISVFDKVNGEKSKVHHVVCDEGYHFEKGIIKKEVTCLDGTWVIPENVYPQFTHPGSRTCSPICSRPCKNEGICVAPDTCLCPKPYEGPQCEDHKEKLCWQHPLYVDNSFIVYSPFNSTITCKSGYRLSNGEITVFLKCYQGNWMAPSNMKLEDIFCFPMCKQPCLNNGVCVAPDTCKCKEGYIGKNCNTTEDTIRCAANPLPTENSTISIDNSGVHLKCDPGYELPSGYPETQLTCVNQTWISSIPGPNKPENLVCEPVCMRGCLNNGTCVAPNFCLCTEDYAGPFCQYLNCKNKPPEVANAILKISSDGLEAVEKCLPGYKTRWGDIGIVFQCVRGNWYFKDTSIQSPVFECFPACSVPCLNGGWCYAPDVCMCSEGFTGKQCEKRYEMTVKGQKCVFPFMYKGHWYYGCTATSYHRPWCATDLALSGIIKSWGVCLADLGNIRVVATTEGQLCTFPFYYNGVKYNNCTYVDRPYPWCAVMVDSIGKMTRWGKCDLDYGTEVVSVTISGQHCQLPFTVNSHSYHGCAHDKYRPWCLTRGKDKKQQRRDVCLANWGSSGVIMAEDGNLCIFPFLHNGREYHQCTARNSKENERWCPTKVTKDRHPIKWSPCLLYKDEWNGISLPPLYVLYPHFKYIMIEVTTVHGVKCVFPFTWNKKNYTGCVHSNKELPWCAIGVDSNGNVLRKDICPLNWDIDSKLVNPVQQDPSYQDPVMMDIITIEGVPCKLPFIHKGKERRSCIKEPQMQPWCAISVNALLVPTKVGVCISSSDGDEDLQSVLDISRDDKTPSNKGCVTRFKYKGKIRYGCIDIDSMEKWCPISKDYSGEPLQWQDCSAKNCTDASCQAQGGPISFSDSQSNIGTIQPNRKIVINKMRTYIMHYMNNKNPVNKVPYGVDLNNINVLNMPDPGAIKSNKPLNNKDPAHYVATDEINPPMQKIVQPILGTPGIMGPPIINNMIPLSLPSGNNIIPPVPDSSLIVEGHYHLPSYHIPAYYPSSPLRAFIPQPQNTQENILNNIFTNLNQWNQHSAKPKQPIQSSNQNNDANKIEKAKSPLHPPNQQWNVLQYTPEKYLQRPGFNEIIIDSFSKQPNQHSIKKAFFKQIVPHHMQQNIQQIPIRSGTMHQHIPSMQNIMHQLPPVPGTIQHMQHTPLVSGTRQQYMQQIPVVSETMQQNLHYGKSVIPIDQNLKLNKHINYLNNN